MDDAPTAAPDARLSLREITAETVRRITDLEVAPGQSRYVASNAVSIAQAHFHPGAWFRAVYLDDTPIGFAMLEDRTRRDADAPPSEVFLWRFMIDSHFQRRGHGRQALRLVVDEARSRPGATTLRTSYVEGPDEPRDFYLGFGFRPTGETTAGGEICLALPLR